MQLVFSQVGRPRGRGKIERFFQSVEQLLLEQLPGYAPKEVWPRTLEPGRAKESSGVLTLSELEQRGSRTGCSRTIIGECKKDNAKGRRSVGKKKAFCRECRNRWSS
jgi:transposase InsO family protein